MSMLQKGDNSFALDTGRIALSFSTQGCLRLTSLRGNGDDFISPAAQGDSALWRVVMLGPDGVNPAFTTGNAIFDGIDIKTDTDNDACFTLRWHLRPTKNTAMEVRVTIEAKRGSALTFWSFEMDTLENWLVHQVEFPRFIHVNMQLEAPELIVPSGWGLAYAFAPGYVFTGDYPSCLQGMQFMGVMQRKGNFLYLATHDTEACLKTFRAKATTTFGELLVDAPASSAWSPNHGGLFALPWKAAVGVTEDWKTALRDWYRPFTFRTVWGQKTFDAAAIPAWLLDADLWLRPMFATEETEKGIEHGLDYFGNDVGLHWYRWHEIEYDTDYPQYFPPKAEFSGMMKKAQARGAHVVPYINGRLWDPSSESWKSDAGAATAARKYDGTLYTEVYGSRVANAVACPSTTVWRGKITRLVERLLHEVGSDGVYIDQICAAPGVPCWSTKHEHPTGGGAWWHYAYRKLMGQVREKVGPENILITEENAECFMDLFDVLLLVNTPQDGSRPIPMWPMVYSDRCLMIGFQYYSPNEPAELLPFFMKNALSLLWGSQLGWIDPNRVLVPGCERAAEFLLTLKKFRREQHDLIYGGQFINDVTAGGDNPVIKSTYRGPFDGKVYPLETNAVLGAQWRGANGKEAVLLVNIDSADHTVTVSDGIGVRECMLKAGLAARIEI